MKTIFKYVITILIVVGVSFYSALIISKNKDRTIYRLKRNMKLLEKLLKMKNENKEFSKQLSINKVDKIAVYGNGVVGKQVIQQLINEGLHVSYIIDQACNVFKEEAVPVYRPDMNLPDADIIIVTPISDFAEIKEQLKQKKDCPIISVEELLEA